MSIGIDIARKAGLSLVDERRIAALIDAAITEAFRCGFDHAVKGGLEAGRRFPQLKDATPLVLYVADKQTRNELIDLFKVTHPEAIEARIPDERG